MDKCQTFHVYCNQSQGALATERSVRLATTGVSSALRHKLAFGIIANPPSQTAPRPCTAQAGYSAGGGENCAAGSNARPASQPKLPPPLATLSYSYSPPPLLLSLVLPYRSSSTIAAWEGPEGVCGGTGGAGAGRAAGRGCGRGGAGCGAGLAAAADVGGPLNCCFRRLPLLTTAGFAAGEFSATASVTASVTAPVTEPVSASAIAC